MNHMVLAAMVGFCVSGSAMADPTFVQKLRGSAAYCGIQGSLALGEAESERRKSGEASKKYKHLLDNSFRVAKSCVANERPKIKESFKLEVGKHPSARSAIASAYASWLGYMDVVETPRISPESVPEQREFEAAVNRLEAEMDLM